MQDLLAGAEETKELMRITIEYQETRKPYRWKKAFTARVLFADRKAIFTRGGGSHQRFWPSSGKATSWGWDPKHPEVQRNMGDGLGGTIRTGWWRIHPASMHRLREHYRLPRSRRKKRKNPMIRE
jgi:hypothetical protein